MREKNKGASGNAGSGFTLIELLVVLAIIGILASLILSALARPTTVTKIQMARIDMNHIVSAIKQYEMTYGTYPIAKDILSAGMPDFTFGASPAQMMASGKVRDNSEIMEILTDTARPGGVNQDHRRNPNRLQLLDAKMVNGTSPGLSTTDWIFRDPWGHPYIITIDLNDDGKCLDALYATQDVSQSAQNQGLHGLINSQDANGNGDHFELNQSVMVWSFGPDGEARQKLKADSGVNKDNVLSWK